jgi:hypothetical protein
VSAEEILAGFDWRYLSRGRAKHGFYNAPSSGNTPARCGRFPARHDPSGWMGTGEQREYERLAALPYCKRCVRLLLQDRGLEPLGPPERTAP